MDVFAQNSSVTDIGLWSELLTEWLVPWVIWISRTYM